MASNIIHGEFEFKLTGVELKPRLYKGNKPIIHERFEILSRCSTYAGLVAAFERRGMSVANAWATVDWAAKRGLIHTPGLEVWRERQAAA